MISRHLALLRDDKLVEARREGQWMYYRLHPQLSEWACDVIQRTAEACRHQAPFHNDLQVLADMPNRPGAACCA